MDGHNRHEICTRNRIEFQTVSREFASHEEAKQWIIGNQLGRRNLRSEARALLQGKLYNFHKKKVGAPSGNENASNQSGKSCHIVKTSQQIAAQTGTSEKTVRNNGKFAEAVELLGIESDIMAGTELPPPKKIMRQKVRLQF